VESGHGGHGGFGSHLIRDQQHQLSGRGPKFLRRWVGLNPIEIVDRLLCSRPLVDGARQQLGASICRPTMMDKENIFWIGDYHLDRESGVVFLLSTNHVVCSGHLTRAALLRYGSSGKILGDKYF